MDAFVLVFALFVVGLAVVIMLDIAVMEIRKGYKEWLADRNRYNCLVSGEAWEKARKEWKP